MRNVCKLCWCVCIVGSLVQAKRFLAEGENGGDTDRGVISPEKEQDVIASGKERQQQESTVDGTHKILLQCYTKSYSQIRTGVLVALKKAVQYYSNHEPQQVYNRRKFENYNVQ